MKSIVHKRGVAAVLTPCKVYINIGTHVYTYLTSVLFGTQVVYTQSMCTLAVYTANTLAEHTYVAYVFGTQNVFLFLYIYVFRNLFTSIFLDFIS